jgi:hypothetical protein
VTCLEVSCIRLVDKEKVNNLDQYVTFMSSAKGWLENVITLHTSLNSNNVNKYFISLLSSLKEKCDLKWSPSCMSAPPINFWTSWYFFMKFRREVMSLKMPQPHIFNSVASTFPKWWTFKLLTWMQNFYQSMWYNDTLYADKSLENRQLLIKPLLWETKDTNIAGGWSLKFTFRFMETTHEPLHLNKQNLIK